MIFRYLSMPRQMMLNLFRKNYYTSKEMFYIMKRIKAKVYLDETSYIDFETNSFRYIDKNGSWDSIDLNVNERIILNFLCRKYNNYVSNTEIFKDYYGREYNVLCDTLEPLTKIISKLRLKIINKSGKNIIVSHKKGIFQLQLKDSPFEDIEKYNIISNEEGNQIVPIPLATVDFFETALSNKSQLGKIKSIDMAFQGGSMWLYDGIKYELLTNAIENGIDVRIIVNKALEVEPVASHMRLPGLKYTGFEENARNWNDFMTKYPNKVKVHIAQVPLLRRIYMINGESNKGWANITYYSYGNDILKDQRMCFESTNTIYQLYLNEYNYIWNNASKPYSSLDVE